MSGTGITELTEDLVPGPAAALAGLLDVPEPDTGELPLLWHWCYLLDRPRTADLGRDGHPALPPELEGRRRMWAGGHVEVLGPLRLGAPATRRSAPRDPVVKQGRSGRLDFVAVDHEIIQDGAVVVRERQDLVYRASEGSSAPHPGRFEPEPAQLAEGEWELPITAPLLFRFSALTYNAHRIHYDRDYARDGEGYPGLLVHGPLQALAMAEAARAVGVPTRAGLVLDYRLLAPLFDHQGLVVHAEPTSDAVEASCRDHGGRRTATATLTG